MAQKPTKKRTVKVSRQAVQIVAFTELDEAFFRAGDEMSESGEWTDPTGELTVEEMYAPLPLAQRVRYWLRSLVSGTRPSARAA